MRYCKQCGIALKEGATYCEKCSENINTSIVTKKIRTYTCNSCNSEEITYNPKEFYLNIIIIMIIFIGLILVSSVMEFIMLTVFFSGLIYYFFPGFIQISIGNWSVKCKACGKNFYVKKPPVGYSHNLTKRDHK